MRAPARGLVLALVAVVLAGAVAGCSLLPGPTLTPVDQLPLGVKVATPPELLLLRVSNSTTMPVVVAVNGNTRDLAADDSLQLGLADLGPLPWHAQVRHVSGRSLLEVVVNAGDTWRLRGVDGSVEYGGDAGRVALSCGLISISTMETQRGGPAPDGGVPGDCD